VPFSNPLAHCLWGFAVATNRSLRVLDEGNNNIFIYKNTNTHTHKHTHAVSREVAIIIHSACIIGICDTGLESLHAQNAITSFQHCAKCIWLYKMKFFVNVVFFFFFKGHQITIQRALTE